jgi:hypothetical protein
MKVTLSSRILAILFIAVLAISAANTYMLYYTVNMQQGQRQNDLNQLNNQIDQNYLKLNQSDTDTVQLLNGTINNASSDLIKRLPLEQYDYIIYRVWQNGSIYEMKNGKTGNVDASSTDAAKVFNWAVANGSSVYIKDDTYELNGNIQISNKKNSQLDSDGAILKLNGHQFTVQGDSFQTSQNNQLSGFTVENGTIAVQNSFRTTVANLIFVNCSRAIELFNTNTWTEATKIDTVHFDKCLQGIVFRTNATSRLDNTNSTGSYANTEITRCYFNIEDNAIGISIEPQAEFTDGKIDNVRFWMGEFGRFNQTGIKLDGSMYKTQLTNVVFESFAAQPLDSAQFYAMQIGNDTFQTPILGSSVNFLGSWTARINNPYCKWIYGVGAVFKQANVTVTSGLCGYGAAQIVQVHPANIANFKAKVTVNGSFQNDEKVTVRFRVEYVDNWATRPEDAVEKTFTTANSTWLNDDDFLKLYAYPDMIFVLLIDAKVSGVSDAKVTVDIYGTVT